MARLIFCLLLLAANFTLCAQEPRRAAFVGVNGTFHRSGMAVDTVVPASTMHVLGVRKNDTLVSINGAKITDMQALRKATALRAGDAVAISLRRGTKAISRKSIAVGKPYETGSNAEIIYGWADGDCKLRTMVYKPKMPGKMPAVLLVPGYNCGSIENYKYGSYGKLIDTWVAAGFAVVTIEKSGMGDSYGCIPCAEADLVSDIRVFEAGYKYMKASPFADTANLFVWGHSMGGIIAPLIAEKYHPRGVIAFATVFRPWSEFLLEMHRVQAPLDGKSYTETEDLVRALQKVYYEFFVLRKSPAELHMIPEYKETVERELEYKAGDNNMWGRHWRFWQQIDSLNMAASWSNVPSKVLSVFGGADFVACSELEHQLIARTVNTAHPGNATHITIPDVDHLLVSNPDWKSAHKHFMDAAYKNTHFHQGLADETVKWMKAQIR